MALIVLSECINCAACEDECPNDAITAGDDIYVIEAGRCTECVGFEEKPQCVAVCPVDCIVRDPDHAESLAVLRARYRELHGEDAPEIGQGLVNS